MKQHKKQENTQKNGLKDKKTKIKNINPQKRIKKTVSPTSENGKQDKLTKEEQLEIEKISKDIQNNKNPDDRFYCTNTNLLKEMYKWRNSSKNGLPVMKMLKNGKLIPTKIMEDTDQKHEPFQKRTTYVIKYPKTHKRFLDWLLIIEKNKKKKEKGIIRKKKDNPFENPTFIKIGRQYVLEDVTKLVEYNGWTFDIDDPLDPINGRVMSEKFGTMIMMIAQKISNHSYFRNYSLELKQDCQSYSYEKIIKGLFNYSFKYTNVFAYLTQACFNSFKSILSKYYKQINIRRARTKQAIINLDAQIPGSSMRKSLNNQFENNDYDDFSEF